MPMPECTQGKCRACRVLQIFVVRWLRACGAQPPWKVQGTAASASSFLCLYNQFTPNSPYRIARHIVRDTADSAIGEGLITRYPLLGSDPLPAISVPGRSGLLIVRRFGRCVYLGG